MNLKAFLIFHLNVGARLALNKLTPVLGAIFALYFIFKPELFNEFFSDLLSEGSLIPGVLFTLLCSATASMASKRVCLGLIGWMRHLPVSGLATRRLAEIAVFVAQTPILLVLIFFPCFSVLYHRFIGYWGRSIRYHPSLESPTYIHCLISGCKHRLSEFVRPHSI